MGTLGQAICVFVPCRFWNTRLCCGCWGLVSTSWFGWAGDLCLDNASVFFRFFFGALWYISGVGGVVFMYQPHWGLSTPLPLGTAPNGRVGIMTPFSARFILGIYLSMSWPFSRLIACDRNDPVLFITERTGFAEAAYGDGFASNLDALCSFPMVQSGERRKRGR